MPGLLNTLLLTLLIASSSAKINVYTRVKKTLANIALRLTDSDRPFYATEDDLYEEFEDNKLHRRNIDKMYKNPGEHDALYSLMYDSLLLSLIQDCYTAMLPSECFSLNEHFNLSMLLNFQSKPNKNSIKMYRDTSELPDNLVQIIEYDFLDPFDIIRYLFTKISHRIDSSAEEHRTVKRLNETIATFSEYLKNENNVDKLVDMLNKVIYQLKNMQAMLKKHGAEDKITIKVVPKASIQEGLRGA